MAATKTIKVTQAEQEVIEEQLAKLWQVSRCRAAADAIAHIHVAVFGAKKKLPQTEWANFARATILRGGETPPAQVGADDDE